MARKATSSRSTRTVTAKTATKTAKSKATSGSGKATSKAVAAKAAVAKKATTSKRATSRVVRAAPAVSPDILLVDDGFAHVPDLIAPEDLPLPEPSDFSDRILFGEVFGYSVSMNGGSRSVLASGTLRSHLGNGPTITINIQGDLTKQIRAASGDRLQSATYLFQDSLAGRVETEQRNGRATAFIGMPAAQLHPMHYLLQAEKPLKCRTHATVRGGKITLYTMDFYAAQQKVGERSK